MNVKRYGVKLEFGTPRFYENEDGGYVMYPHHAAAIEFEAGRLAACGVAAMMNTRASASQHRLVAESPFRSASYNDVERAVEREMTFRELADEARALLAATAERLDTLSLPEKERQHAAVTAELMCSRVRIDELVERLTNAVHK